MARLTDDKLRRLSDIDDAISTNDEECPITPEGIEWMAKELRVALTELDALRDECAAKDEALNGARILLQGIDSLAVGLAISNTLKQVLYALSADSGASWRADVVEECAKIAEDMTRDVVIGKNLALIGNIAKEIRALSPKVQA